MKKRTLLLTAAVVLLLATSLWQQLDRNSNATVSLSGQTMGTSWHVKINPAGEKVQPEQLQQLIQLRLDQLNSSLSTYQPDSEVSRFNNAASGEKTTLSSDALNVVSRGLEISQQTGGAFDMTVGRLVNLWGFGPDLTTTIIPAAEEIARLREQIGYDKLELNPQTAQLVKNNPLMSIDLSAIAKGYAVDAVATLLTKNGIAHYVVEIGGEIVTRGHKAADRPWLIGIEKPLVEQRTVSKAIPLTDAAMATSGDYRNYFEVDGQRYSHTIDPQSGYPIAHKLASVSVIANSCMDADALATALMVMGPEQGLNFAEQNNLAVYMLVKKDDQFTEKQSTAFTEFLKRETLQ